MNSDLYTTFACYGVRTDGISINRFFEDGRDWFQRLGCRLKSREAQIGSKFIRRLRTPSAADLDGFDGYTEVTYPIPRNKRVYSGVLTFHRSIALVAISLPSSVASISSVEISDIITSVESDLLPHYGFGFYRHLEHGPMLYVYGIGVVRTDDENAKVARHEDKYSWCNSDDKSLFDKGLIRGVYAWNLLNESQLSARVDGVSLRKWIAQDACRGELQPSKHNTECAIWTLPHRSSRLEIERTLCHAGIVYHDSRYSCDQRTSLNY